MAIWVECGGGCAARLVRFVCRARRVRWLFDGGRSCPWALGSTLAFMCPGRFLSLTNQMNHCTLRFTVFARCARELGEEDTRCKYPLSSSRLGHSVLPLSFLQAPQSNTLSLESCPCWEGHQLASHTSVFPLVPHRRCRHTLATRSSEWGVCLRGRAAVDSPSREVVVRDILSRRRVQAEGGLSITRIAPQCPRATPGTPSGRT